jgi:hypothetical protein
MATPHLSDSTGTAIACGWDRVHRSQVNDAPAHRAGSESCSFSSSTPVPGPAAARGRRSTLRLSAGFSIRYQDSAAGTMTMARPHPFRLGGRGKRPQRDGSRRGPEPWPAALVPSAALARQSEPRSRAASRRRPERWKLRSAGTHSRLPRRTCGCATRAATLYRPQRAQRLRLLVITGTTSNRAAWLAGRGVLDSKSDGAWCPARRGRW